MCTDANIFEQLDYTLTDGDGFWRDESQSVVRAAAIKLQLLGMGDAEVVELISAIWSACRKEYEPVFGRTVGDGQSQA